MNVFNYSKNNKYEKDMTNEIFKRLIKSKKILKRLYLFTKEFNFFINAIDILNENEFFLNNYLISKLITKKLNTLFRRL